MLKSLSHTPKPLKQDYIKWNHLVYDFFYFLTQTAMGVRNILYLQLSIVKPPNKLAKANKAVLFARIMTFHLIGTSWHRRPKDWPAVTSRVSACGDWIRCLTLRGRTGMSQTAQSFGLARGPVITHALSQHNADHYDTCTLTHMRADSHTLTHKPGHFTPYQSLSSKCSMKCNVVEQIQGL